MISSPSPFAADLVGRLRELYHDSSKHSAYQSVPAFMARVLGYQEEINSLWRSDTPRDVFIAARLDLPKGASVADVGANTGFFSLNLAHRRPDVRIAAYELNPRHAEFIELAAAAFALPVGVHSLSCDLAGVTRLPVVDTVFLLNVLHHAGFDFDRGLADDNATLEAYVVDYLSRLRTRARQLVFQIGSNRGGDTMRPLFPRDHDCVRLNWIARTLKAAGWTIEHLGYAQLDGGSVCFRDAAPDLLAAARAGDVAGATVIARLAELGLDRFPGEFHRRPLVIATTVSL